MMNRMQKSQAFNLSPGSIILGKWHKQKYMIRKQLGYGATGVVYLADGAHGPVALKLSEDNMAISSEVNVLKKFSKAQGAPLGPSLLDVDDWVIPGKSAIPFYVMEYIQGTPFLSFIQNRGFEWTGILMLQLLSDLERLHQDGWVFGDLKPDNLMVAGPPPKIRLLDVGGTTIAGRAIKEYTEFFDRGYWGLGTRKADPQYDLFAVAMVMINAAYPSRFNKQGEGLSQLNKAILSKATLKPFHSVLLPALQGKYSNATEMRDSLLKQLDTIRQGTVQTRSQQQQKQQGMSRRKKPQQHAVNRQTTKPTKQTSKSGMLDTVLLFLFLLIVYGAYVFWQLGL